MESQEKMSTHSKTGSIEVNYRKKMARDEIELEDKRIDQ